MQAKALVKIINFAKAFAQKDFRILDNHTHSIMINTMVNNDVISSRTASAKVDRAVGNVRNQGAQLAAPIDA